MKRHQDNNPETMLLAILESTFKIISAVHAFAAIVFWISGAALLWLDIDTFTWPRTLGCIMSLLIAKTLTNWITTPISLMGGLNAGQDSE